MINGASVKEWISMAEERRKYKICSFLGHNYRCTWCFSGAK